MRATTDDLRRLRSRSSRPGPVTAHGVDQNHRQPSFSRMFRRSRKGEFARPSTRRPDTCAAGDVALQEPVGAVAEVGPRARRGMRRVSAAGPPGGRASGRRALAAPGRRGRGEAEAAAAGPGSDANSWLVGRMTAAWPSRTRRRWRSRRRSSRPAAAGAPEQPASAERQAPATHASVPRQSHSRPRKATGARSPRARHVAEGARQARDGLRHPQHAATPQPRWQGTARRGRTAQCGAQRQRRHDDQARHGAPPRWPAGRSWRCG